MAVYFSITIAIGIAALSVWAFLLQTNRKAKILLIVIGVYALTQAAKDIYSSVISRPEPSLVLTEIEEHYDGEPPTALLFLPNVENAGDAVATNVRTELRAYIDSELVANTEDKQPDIGPGQAVRLRASLKGDEFARVWNEESKLRIVLDVSYAGRSGKKYSQSFEGNYSPHPDAPVVHPGWDSARNLPPETAESPQ